MVGPVVDGGGSLVWWLVGMGLLIDWWGLVTSSVGLVTDQWGGFIGVDRWGGFAGVDHWGESLRWIIEEGLLVQFAWDWFFWVWDFFFFFFFLLFRLVVLYLDWFGTLGLWDLMILLGFEKIVELRFMILVFSWIFLGFLCVYFLRKFLSLLVCLLGKNIRFMFWDKKKCSYKKKSKTKN